MLLLYLERMASNPDVEGTPLLGPLPLELQQIKDQKDAAAALAARRRSEDVKTIERNILKIRRRSFGESSLSPEDSATRRSSRAIKRRKFDDEISEPNLIIPPSTPQPCTPGIQVPALGSVESRSRNSSVCLTEPTTPVSGLDNNCLANSLTMSDLRLKKLIRDKRKRKGRKDELTKDLGRWKPTDDIALVTAVEQTKDLNLVFKGVKFSCHFTLSEIQERWYTLLFDPVISQLAQQAMKNLPQEVVHKVNYLVTYILKHTLCIRGPPCFDSLILMFF